MTEGSAITSIRQYLELLAEMRASDISMEGFVLRHGVAFESNALSLAEINIVHAAYKRAAVRCAFEMRECWWNAKALVKADKTGTLRYAEGYANNMIPTLHAWVAINGKVVDLTWRKNFREPGTFENWRVGVFEPPIEYHGIIFSAEELREFMPKHKGSLIDNYEERWPLLHSTDFRTPARLPHVPFHEGRHRSPGPGPRDQRSHQGGDQPGFRPSR